MLNEVTYFRPRIAGPELAVEDAVIKNVNKIVSRAEEKIWLAGSLRIGAGMPDLLITTYNPRVLKLSQLELKNYRVLAYLRMNHCVEFEPLLKIADVSPKKFSEQMEWLLDHKVIFVRSNRYFLFPVWYEILPEIIAVEAKVSDWQKAIHQANRNKIFAHRSYVALPEKVAKRIKNQSILKKSGLGLLSVDEENNITLLRKGRRSVPYVWSYYYQLAFTLANDQTKNDAIYCSTCDCSSRLP